MTTSSSLSKRKSNVFREDDLLLTAVTVNEEQVQGDDAFDHRDHTRLARVIQRLTGAELARAIAMINDGLHSGVTPIANEVSGSASSIRTL